MRVGYVYILTNQRNRTLYTGVTSNLVRRIHEHREGGVPGFTKTHDLKRLVYYEQIDRVEDAIQREKQIKGWRRQWKINLIERQKPDWRDLWKTIAN